jgi:hypothetical protein
MINPFIPTFTDISDWELRVYQNTTGSRSKKIAIHPETNVEYFFKGSKELETGEIRYPTEFWSEIVSSKIGQILGFNMLDYNIAYSNHPNLKQKIGCLSESMVKHSENKLNEGKVFLTGYDSNYHPDLDKKKYTFQFIRDTLIFFNLKNEIEQLIEIIIFDAIVSNSDRHQENWGVISYFHETILDLKKDLENETNPFIGLIQSKFVLKIFDYFINAKNPKQITSVNSKGNKKLRDLVMLINSKFSPIYDSGCCLGRELADDYVLKMLSENQMLNSYINKGVSEIHWQGDVKKQKHFELVGLLKDDYQSKIEKVLLRVRDKFNKQLIEETIWNIDKNLPEHLATHSLSNSRKELMVKLITLRIEKLLA